MWFLATERNSGNIKSQTTNLVDRGPVKHRLLQEHGQNLGVQVMYTRAGPLVHYCPEHARHIESLQFNAMLWDIHAQSGHRDQIQCKSSYQQRGRIHLDNLQCLPSRSNAPVFHHVIAIVFFLKITIKCHKMWL